eukprot:18324_1
MIINKMLTSPNLNHFLLQMAHKIQLKYHSQKGQYLLGDDATNYWSTKASDDWVTFSIESSVVLKPITIRIINSKWTTAIASISLFIGSDTNWFQLCPNITNIKKGADLQ